MSKQQYSKSAKNCATCDFWEGPREINNSRSTVTVGSSRDEGKCIVPGGQKGKNKQAYNSCSDWQKWGDLR